MAYIGMRKYYSAYADIFDDVCSILVAAGWTLYDTVSATSKVYRSQGEAGDRPYLYLHVYVSSNLIYSLLWLYWDSATHTGNVGPYNNNAGTTYNKLTLSSSAYHMICASKDFLCMTSPSSNKDGFQIRGHAPKLFHPTPKTTLTAGALAGSSVQLTVASSTGFLVGKKYQIVGQSEGRDQLTVESVADGTHITVVSLPRNYASGAFLSPQPTVGFCNSGNSTISNWFAVSWATSEGLTAAPTTVNFLVDTSRYPVPYTSIDPDAVGNGYGLLSLLLTQDGLYGYLDDYILLGPYNQGKDTIIGVYDSGIPENGTVSSAGPSTLTDSGKSWVTNAWQNKQIVVVDGTGVGQARTIASNTSNTLTVDVAWDVTPDATSVYRIVDEVWRGGDERTYFWVKETCQKVPA